MERHKNNRLDELFNQAKNEPSKVSFYETKEQFIKSSAAVGNVSWISKLIQLSNLKFTIMISTLSIVLVGTVMYFNNSTNEPLEVIENSNIEKEVVLTETDLLVDGHIEIVQTHMKKVKLLPSNLKEVYHVKKKLGLKLREVEIDTLLCKSNGKFVSERNQEILDTAYRFPNLGYEEVTANNRQKSKMLGKYKKSKRKNNQLGKLQTDIKGFLYIPSGKFTSNNDQVSVQSFYMKETEVSNLEYRTFLFDLLINGRKKEFLKAKPDQKMWVKEYPSSFNKPMQENYFSHPAYDDYPAVGMSRVGADLYCKWFTEELNKISEGKRINNVRLPSNYEWEYAASGGKNNRPYPWGGPYVRNSKGCYLANFKPLREKSDTGANWKVPYDEKKNQYNFKADGGFHTVKTNSYFPNEYGLYCMSGNVAEMIFYKNQEMLPGTKGGSWTSIGQELQIADGKDRFIGQTTPSCNIGFRPVITYSEANENNRLVGVMGSKAITVIPPGTKKIGHNLFFDESELSNIAWLEYLNWIERTSGKSSNEYKKALPDTTVWTKKIAFGEPYKVHYLGHPAYNNYPVVGINYEQAVSYCKWRTERVKERFEVLKQKDKKGIYPKNFVYRLPTKEEWKRVAKVGFSLKTLKKLETKYEGQNRYNLKRGDGDAGGAGRLNDNADVTAPIDSYWPNKYGIYNLIGNVAEMTATKGIAKGGAWIYTEKEVDVEKDFKYTAPTEWLGFRCIFEVKD